MATAGTLQPPPVRFSGMDNVSAGEAGGVFAGVVALLAVVGKGIDWLFARAERRTREKDQRLAAWEESLDRREKAQRVEMNLRLRDLFEGMHLLIGTTADLIEAHRRIDPESAAIKLAEAALRKVYLLDFDTPPDLAELIGEVEAAIAARGHARG